MIGCSVLQGPRNKFSQVYTKEAIYFFEKPRRVLENSLNTQFLVCSQENLAQYKPEIDT